MIIVGPTNAEFNELIITTIPRMAKVPLIQQAISKYTSGYLSGARLLHAVAAGSLPTIALGETDKGRSAQTLGDDILVDRNYFRYYSNDQYPQYRMRAPITIFHELAHWGYQRGQSEGHPSDKFGRAHHNDDEGDSPLNPELERIIRTILLLNRPFLL